MAQKRCYSSPTDLQKSGLKESDVSLAGGGGGGGGEGWSVEFVLLFLILDLEPVARLEKVKESLEASLAG